MSTHRVSLSLRDDFNYKTEPMTEGEARSLLVALTRKAGAENWNIADFPAEHYGTIQVNMRHAIVWMAYPAETE